jgi:hypothetical protein
MSVVSIIEAIEAMRIDATPQASAVLFSAQMAVLASQGAKLTIGNGGVGVVCFPVWPSYEERLLSGDCDQ